MTDVSVPAIANAICNATANPQSISSAISSWSAAGQGDAVSFWGNVDDYMVSQGNQSPDQAKHDVRATQSLTDPASADVGQASDMINAAVANGGGYGDSLNKALDDYTEKTGRSETDFFNDVATDLTYVNRLSPQSAAQEADQAKTWLDSARASTPSSGT